MFLRKTYFLRSVSMPIRMASWTLRNLLRPNLLSVKVTRTNSYLGSIVKESCSLLWYQGILKTMGRVIKIAETKCSMNGAKKNSWPIFEPFRSRVRLSKKKILDLSKRLRKFRKHSAKGLQVPLVLELKPSSFKNEDMSQLLNSRQPLVINIIQRIVKFL